MNIFYDFVVSCTQWYMICLMSLDKCHCDLTLRWQQKWCQGKHPLNVAMFLRSWNATICPEPSWGSCRDILQRGCNGSYDETKSHNVHKWGIDLPTLAAFIINHESFWVPDFQELQNGYCSSMDRHIIAGLELFLCYCFGSQDWVETGYSSGQVWYEANRCWDWKYFLVCWGG